MGEGFSLRLISPVKMELNLHFFLPLFMFNSKETAVFYIISDRDMNPMDCFLVTLQYRVDSSDVEDRVQWNLARVGKFWSSLLLGR